MRWTSSSLVSLGLLGLGCGDDALVGETTGPVFTTGVSASTGDPVTASSVTIDPSADSGSSDTNPTGGPTGTTQADTTGTPADSSTGPTIQCGDDVAEGDEICDGTDLGAETCESQGFASGELACLPDCSGYDTRACTVPVCGNAAAEGDEICDGVDLLGATCRSQGFDSGTISCENDCSALDTSECGTCGNVIVDGDEVCDDIVLFGQTCITQGYEHGDLGCAPDCLSYDTSGCGLCGDGAVGGAEECDGGDLGGASCVSLGADGGVLGCAADCTFDTVACDFPFTIYDVSAPNTSSTQNTYFRGHGYTADGPGTLIDFEVYLGLAAACNLDFYVHEAPGFGGPYTQVQRTTVAAGPGTQYYAAGLSPVPVIAGNYYILGVAWNCSATYYWDGTGAYAGVDAGIGIFNVSHWDNGYPGASDLYVPPNTGTGNTVYVHRVTFAG
ncbi:hypothetical protein [Paraliomyxa miuraensis]|uniref:hypothetical protein n=1 Tax=Paraliomyxa miuraensis TaxID=376150 RepID=UPI00224EC713|nr:hypothetical protein [Paraliomyxa miuraensis]MCX4248051.1 hypothetical protein [Paraliomyxa miuraensis]